MLPARSLFIMLVCDGVEFRYTENLPEHPSQRVKKTIFDRLVHLHLLFSLIYFHLFHYFFYLKLFYEYLYLLLASWLYYCCCFNGCKEFVCVSPLLSSGLKESRRSRTKALRPNVDYKPLKRSFFLLFLCFCWGFLLFSASPAASEHNFPWFHGLDD